MRERIAGLITNTFNPFVMSGVVMAALSFKGSATIADGFKWAAISLAESVLPVFVAVVYLVRRRKMDGFFSNPREQRNLIYILASVLGAAGCGILWGLGAPRALAVTFTAGLIAIIVFMTINYFWKISLHTAFAAASVAVIIMVYGAVSAWIVVVLPPVAWARLQLKQHSIAQVVTAALLAPAIVGAVFWGFGMIG